MAERIIQLETRLAICEAHLFDGDPHAHVHQGYLCVDDLETQVNQCLERAAIAAEAELPPPKQEPAKPANPGPAKPAPAPAPKPAPKEERKAETGPAGQGAPDRRHGLHRKVGTNIHIGRRA